MNPGLYFCGTLRVHVCCGGPQVGDPRRGLHAATLDSREGRSFVQAGGGFPGEQSVEPGCKEQK